jgi:hypothetical protein
MQEAEEVQDTPVRTFDCVLVVSAEGTMVQVLPSKLSTRVWSTPVEESTELPTAMQVVELGQDTEERTFGSEAEVSGLGTMDQEVPSKVSMRVCSVPELPVAA